MPSPCIVLVAPNGQTWSSPAHLRIGRLTDLDIPLDDPSVSRLHAEVFLHDDGWMVRDRGSSNGTHVNGVRIGRTPQKLSVGDAIQIGTFRLRVDQVQERVAAIRIGGRSVQIEAASAWSWEDGPDPWEQGDPNGTGTGAVRLMRAGLRLANAPHPDLALQGLLGEAVRFFQGRRCGLFLCDDAGQLALKCFSANTSHPMRPPGKALAAAALKRRQSILFQDAAAEPAQMHSDSAVRGDIGSVMCAILRTPERELGVLYIDRPRASAAFTNADLYNAESVATAVATGWDRRQLVSQQQNMLFQTITALAQAVEMRDTYTGNHTYRVTTYALLLAEALGLSVEERRKLQIAAALHDIGKIAIDDQVLRKPERLSPAEFAQMKTHVLRGAEIVQMIPGLAWALPVVRGHHERWDGKGYPDGLKGESNPLPARIVAVADAFDAMTSDRPYRKGMDADRAYAELQAGAGTHFDPVCVAGFQRIRPKIEALLAREVEERRHLENSTDTISRKQLDVARGTAVSAALPSALSETPLPPATSPPIGSGTVRL